MMITTEWILLVAAKSRGAIVDPESPCRRRRSWPATLVIDAHDGQGKLADRT